MRATRSCSSWGWKEVFSQMVFKFNWSISCAAGLHVQLANCPEIPIPTNDSQGLPGLILLQSPDHMPPPLILHTTLSLKWV